MSPASLQVATSMRSYFAAFVLLFAACGGANAADLVVGDGSPNSTLATVNQVTQQGDEFIVPDFTFGLADGSVFDAAAVDTPIYVMFWAEW